MCLGSCIKATASRELCAESFRKCMVRRQVKRTSSRTSSMHTFNTGWKFFFSTRSFNEIIVTEKPNPGSFTIFLRSSLLTDQSGLRKFVKYIIKALLMINKLILIFY